MLGSIGLSKQLAFGSTTEPILLVHGSFANSSGSGDVPWWQPGSAFCRTLDLRCREQGAAARCWASVKTFAWTGYNSEPARRAGGSALAGQLAALEADASVARYYLVGHSHGGNVILNALQEMTDKPQKLGAVVFMGTPPLRFRRWEFQSVRWLAIPLYVIGLPVTIEILRQTTQPALPFALVPFAIAGALAAEIGALWGRRRGDLYGSGRPYAFQFDCDEAINTLILARDAINDPRRFIDQFLLSSPPQPFAVEPTTAPKEHFIDRLGKKSAAYLLMKKIDSSIWNWLNNWYTTGIFFLIPLIPILIVATLGAIYSFIGRAIGIITGAIGLALAKRFGRLALPGLLRKAVFGEEPGYRFVELLPLPSGVLAYEALSGSLRDEAARASEQFGQGAGQAVMSSLRKMDAFAMKTHLSNALTNAALAHSLYPRAPEVIEKTAKLIAMASSARTAPRMEARTGLTALLRWPRQRQTQSVAPTSGR
jgi:pimeloyl-ACP methyl ester carboxylesterase